MARRLALPLLARLAAGAKRTRGGRAPSADAGYTLVELTVTMAIFVTVLTGLTTLFVQGANAELELNRRVQAQIQARLALDKLRREAHCAKTVTPVGASASVTLTLAPQCPTGSGAISWCTVSRGPGRYALYRKPGLVCDSGGVMYADYLTTATVFTYITQSSSTLAKLRANFPINVDPRRSVGSYRLADDIVLRNSTRS